LLPNREFFGVQVLDDAPGCLSIDDVLPAFFTVGAVLKTDDKFAVFLGHRPVAVQHEAPVVTVGCLDVVLLGVCLDNLEVHPVAARGLERIITEVLGGLDVILVVVGPVELDLLALVGYGIDPFLVTTERNEVACRLRRSSG